MLRFALDLMLLIGIALAGTGDEASEAQGVVRGTGGQAPVVREATSAQPGQRQAQQRARQMRRAQEGVPARPGDSRATPDADVGPATPGVPVRFEAAVYRITLSQENVVKLDTDLLAEHAALEQFDQALRSLGDPELLYRVDQVVAFDTGSGAQRRRGQRIVIEAQVPFVTHSRVTDAGQVQRTISRESIGAIFKLSGAPHDEATDKLTTTLDVTVSAMDEKQHAPDFSSPVFRNVEQAYSGIVDPAKVVVLLSLDNASNSGDHAVAIITRARFSVP